MATSFDDPRAIVQKVFGNLVPGGWVEYQEWAPYGLVGADDSIDERLRHSAMMRFQESFAEGASRLGRDVKGVPRLKVWLTEAGFIDVVEKLVLCPINPWPLNPEDRVLGKYAQRSAWDAMEAATLKVFPHAGMTAEQTKELLGEARKELMDENWRAYYPM
ncbi:S-adenosyl-L-methionine-dependent methyltransferase [Apiospora hydei]|uniref:S-adenosyl-L-methionine-dependent methyltransferase n=1 Tax=Apiospora hydei TaxID=1337664 RepID=A0ABR1VUY6_9PEZI